MATGASNSKERRDLLQSDNEHKDDKKLQEHHKKPEPRPAPRAARLQPWRIDEKAQANAGQSGRARLNTKILAQQSGRMLWTIARQWNEERCEGKDERLSESRREGRSETGQRRKKNCQAPEPKGPRCEEGIKSESESRPGPPLI